MAKKPLDTVLPTILSAANEWQKEHSPEKLKSKVKTMLDAHAEEITMKLLGFSDSWGRWEVDHCNGRSGNSAAGDYLRQHQQAAIQEWMENLCLPKLTPTLKKSLQAEMQKAFTSELSYKLHKAVSNKLDELVQKVLEDLASSDDLEGYLKAIQLITPKENHAS